MRTCRLCTIWKSNTESSGRLCSRLLILVHRDLYSSCTHSKWDSTFTRTVAVVLVPQLHYKMLFIIARQALVAFVISGPFICLCFTRLQIQCIIFQTSSQPMRKSICYIRYELAIYISYTYVAYFMVQLLAFFYMNGLTEPFKVSFITNHCLMLFYCFLELFFFFWEEGSLIKDTSRQ